MARYPRKGEKYFLTRGLWPEERQGRRQEFSKFRGTGALFGSYTSRHLRAVAGKMGSSVKHLLEKGKARA
jgi:hypothetical protein